MRRWQRLSRDRAKHWGSCPGAAPAPLSNQLAHGKTVDRLHGCFVRVVAEDGTVIDAYAQPHGKIPHQAQVKARPWHGVVNSDVVGGCQQP